MIMNMTKENNEKLFTQRFKETFKDEFDIRKAQI